MEKCVNLDKLADIICDCTTTTEQAKADGIESVVYRSDFLDRLAQLLNLDYEGANAFYDRCIGA